MIKFKRLRDSATLPDRGSREAAGFDIYADKEAFAMPIGGMCVVETGIAMSIPAGFFGSIRPRSGLAVRHGIDTMAGVIDSDYRGEIKVVLINHGEQGFAVKPGDRIAQMVIQPHASDLPVSLVDDLEDSDRGEDGFGSTGT